MAVITISKEFSAGGVALAHKLADDLGWRLVGRQALAELAKSLNLSEGEAALLHRGEDSSLFKLVDEVFLHTVRRIAQKPEAALDDSGYFKAVQSFVRAVAAKGDAVIVGWGGQFILADQSDAHHLRVVAPLEQRARRCAALDRCGEVEGKALCQQQDRISSGYIKHYFQRSWDEATAYKLVINTGALDFDLDHAVRIVKAAM